MEDEIVVACNGPEGSYFDDDVRGPCEGPGCEKEICWRPHTPPGAKHLCLECITKWVVAEKTAPAFAITKETLDEVGQFLIATRAKGVAS